jgi:hypothetical protein
LFICPTKPSAVGCKAGNIVTSSHPHVALFGNNDLLISLSPLLPAMPPTKLMENDKGGRSTFIIFSTARLQRFLVFDV